MSYAVTVALAERARRRSGPGMTADVTITIDSATNVLTIPAAALRGTNGNYTVLILGADGTPVAQPVEVGLVTEHHGRDQERPDRRAGRSSPASTRRRPARRPRPAASAAGSAAAAFPVGGTAGAAPARGTGN